MPLFNVALIELLIERFSSCYRAELETSELFKVSRRAEHGKKPLPSSTNDQHHTKVLSEIYRVLRNDRQMIEKKIGHVILIDCVSFLLFFSHPS